MSNAIESGIRSRIRKEYTNLQEAANAVVNANVTGDEFTRSIKSEEFKRTEGRIEGLELALSIMEERS